MSVQVLHQHIREKIPTNIVMMLMYGGYGSGGVVARGEGSQHLNGTPPLFHFGPPSSPFDHQQSPKSKTTNTNEQGLTITIALEI